MKPLHLTPTHSVSTLLVGALGLAVSLTSCSGGGGGGGGGGSSLNQDVESSLQDFGVSTAATPRESAQNEVLPDDYSPMGNTWEVSRTNELFVLGIDHPSEDQAIAIYELTDENGDATADVLWSQDSTEAPWVEERLNSYQFPRSLRSATAADVDGDGLEEAVIVYQDDMRTRIRMVGNAEQSFALFDEQVASESNVTSVSAFSGDFDGDGDDEIAVALEQGGRGTLFFLRYEGGAFAPLPERLDYAPAFSGGTLSLRVATGNLDRDAKDEILLTVNEYSGSVFGPTGTTRFQVLDDASTSFAVLVEGEVQDRDQNGVLRTAINATPAIGDIDGDDVGEVIFGGHEGFARYCDAAPLIAIALDDAGENFASLGTYSYNHYYDNCDSPYDPQTRYVHTNTLDIDNDGLDEIQLHNVIYDDFASAGPWFQVEDWTLPEDTFWDRDFGNMDLTTASIVTGDFTGDDRDDIAIYRQDDNDIEVWGVSEIDGFISEMRDLDVAFNNSQYPTNPILLPVNVDMDSPVLKYDDGEYRLVFTEAIVLAAMAAPPCKMGVGQNTDACTTTYGNTESSSEEFETSVSVSVKNTVGFEAEDPFGFAGAELLASMQVEVSAVFSTAYNLSKTVLYRSGANEDTVVFHTTPIDQYTYTIVSHPDPDLVGEKVVVNLPREPIILQAEREFYNRTVVAGSPQIDASIFNHQIGQTETYPTRGQKNALMSRWDGLEIGPQSVGQGNGETELTIEVGREVGAGLALGISFELDMKTTLGGVVRGTTYGYSVDAMYSITSGSETTYSGVVGAIDSANFAANQYSFGMFTYTQDHPVSNQQFHVINYWVE